MIKPILFNTEMVRAILNGAKTVTRRAVKPQPVHEDGFWKLGGAAWSDNLREITPAPCHTLYNRAPYRPGDILYVRETWQYAYDLDGNEQPIEGTGRYLYAADNSPEPFGFWVNPDGTHRDSMPWRPSIHMPREAARIFLRVTDVRVEKLQDITHSGIEKEGIVTIGTPGSPDRINPFFAFKSLWDSTIKPADRLLYGWEANPWVWVIEFERCEKP